MQIAKTTKLINKTFRGVPITQETEISILTDDSGNYFIKSAGKSVKTTRQSAQTYFQTNFDEFWEYLRFNSLYEKVPELYTKEEAKEIQKLYANTPQKKS